MNRYVAEGLMRDMRRGHRVMVFSVNLDAAEACFLTCLDLILDGEGTRRTRGQQQIESDDVGGYILFRSMVQVRNRAVRGLAWPDIAYLDFDPNVGDMNLLNTEVLFDRRGQHVIFR